MHFHNRPVRGQKPDLIADILWFGFSPFFFLYHNLYILALVLQSKLWLSSPLYSKEFNSAGQTLCVWAIGVDEESWGLSLTLCFQLCSWWHVYFRMGLGNLCGYVCVCPVLPLSAFGCFSWPSYYWFPSPSPHPYSCHPFLVSSRSIFYLLCSSCHCLSTLHVCAIIASSCFLSFLVETFQTFLHLKITPVHSLIEQIHPLAGNCCQFNSVLFYHSFCTVEEMENNVQVIAFHSTV